MAERGRSLTMRHSRIAHLAVFILRGPAAPRDIVRRRPLDTTTMRLPFATRHFE